LGGVKDWALDLEHSRTSRVARVLGLDIESVEELNYEISIEASKDGVIYEYKIEFLDSPSNHLLSEIERLEEGYFVRLAPWELDADYDYRSQYEAITFNSSYVETYQTDISGLLDLIVIEMPNTDLQRIFYRQIFISIIGAMETFLSDAFINQTMSNKYHFRKFVQTHPEFGKRKFELKDIFDEYEDIEDTAKRVMVDTIYHNLAQVRKMYIDTLNIKFPDISNIMPYINMRHDLVHRNGKTKSGELIKLNKSVLVKLLDTVNELVDGIVDEFLFDDDCPF